MLGDETHSYPDILGDVKFRDALVAVAAQIHQGLFLQ